MSSNLDLLVKANNELKDRRRDLNRAANALISLVGSLPTATDEQAAAFSCEALAELSAAIIQHHSRFGEAGRNRKKLADVVGAGE